MDLDPQEQVEAHDAAVDQLDEAYEARDLAQIQSLFGNSPGLLDRYDAMFLLVKMVEQDDLPSARFFINLGLIDIKTDRLDYLQKCKSLPMLELLQEHGMDFKEHGHNILHNFVNNHEALVWLLDQGCDPNRPLDRSLIWGLKSEEKDETVEVLNEAAAQGDVETFQYLVSRGADPTRSIALHRSARCLHDVKVTAMIDYLVETLGFDPNADDNCGGLRYLMTWFEEQGRPLDYAVARGNKAAALALIRHGAETGKWPERKRGLQRLLGQS